MNEFDPMLLVKVLPHGEGLPLPAYQTAGAAGLDLCAAVGDWKTLMPNERWLCPTGFQIEIPQGMEGQIRGRGSMIMKKGVCVAHGVGTVDCDYRGEVFVPLINHSGLPVQINHGDRIAQMVIARYQPVNVVQVDELSDTQRGEGGFGSTGAR